MATITINTYHDTFEVSEPWLLKNTDFQTTEEFLSNYTWDEGEWLYILYKIEVEDEEIASLMKKLEQGYYLFKKDHQEGILHTNTKEKTGYQFSFFDQYGAVGDFQAETMDEMAEKIHEYGFQLCSIEHIKIIK